MITLKINTGTVKARRLAARLGQVVSCRLTRGDGKATRGRVSTCKVICTPAAVRAAHHAFMQTVGKVIWYDAQCPPSA